MPTLTASPPESLNLEVASGTYVAVECGRYDQVRAQAVLVSGTWTTGRIRLQHSIDGATWFDLDDVLELSAAGMSKRIPLDGVAMIRAAVTTAQSGTPCLVNVWLALTGTAFEASVDYFAIGSGIA